MNNYSINEYVFDEIEIGHKESFEETITVEMEDMFRIVSGDINPLHRNDQYANTVSNGKYEKHVIFGMLTASLLSRLAGVYLPGKYSLIHSIDIGFPKPVFVGDTLLVEGEVVDKQEGLNLILVKVAVKNQFQKIVAKGNMKVVVLK